MAPGDPDNYADTELGFELSHSLDREGEALAALNQHRPAIEAFRRALTIRQIRVASIQSDNRQRDLAVVYERTGDEYFTLREYGDAATMYDDGLKIREALAKAHPDDPNFMEDLAVGYDRIARIDRVPGIRQGDPLDKYRASILIRQKLVPQNPLNAVWQENLAIDYDNVGDILIGRNDCSGAVEALHNGLQIRERLADRGPDVPKWQGGLAATLVMLAECNDQARQRLQQAIAVIDKLEHDGKLPNGLRKLRDMAQTRLDALPQ
jgi:tetratricopeptide (TPR) repeat protein